MNRRGEALPGDAAGPSISVAALRESLRVTPVAVTPFGRLGHWNDTDSAFIGFLWGIADDLRCPIAVLTRSADGYVDPICVYRARPPGKLVRTPPLPCARDHRLSSLRPGPPWPRDHTLDT